MSFEEEINTLELFDTKDDYVVRKGSIPILFTSVHSFKHLKEDGTIKLNEPYTKAIALYLNKYFNVNCMVKLHDTGLDSNRDNYDFFNVELLRFIKDNNIKLVIDLHGASLSKDFDVELGTMNNLSASFSTINEFKESFIENGITNVNINDPFKGGLVTQSIYKLDDTEVIQLEINRSFRDYSNLDNLYKLIKCLEKFINQYKEYINR